jgi:hypothetical protein
MTTVANVRTYRGSMNDAVYVGRPTIYGNPFRVNTIDSREIVIERFRLWWHALEQTPLRRRATHELVNKVLLCWCAPQACHAQVIADWLNTDVRAA